MNRSRTSWSSSHVLPWVLGALILRAMIPMGFMPSPSTSLAATLCSTAQDAGTEQIEIPGGSHELPCDYCLTPVFAADPASTPASVFETHVEIISPASIDPVYGVERIRAQAARAPPA